VICGSVFSGAGLLDYGLHLAGIDHAWFCEADEFRRDLLAKRWPRARVHSDVRHVGDGCDPVDLIAGGFPCKGASTAGKRNGFDHPETVLWREMARAVGELRPRYVLVENVANLLAIHDGAVWGEVLGDLASFGYDVSGIAYRLRPLAPRTAATGSSPLLPTPMAREAATDGGLAGRPAEHGFRRLLEPTPTLTDVAVRVEWGDYEPAIRRWEAIHGPAPEPLVRRVDDRSAARVERSRLSALGDGVQVQVGRIAGEYIVELDVGPHSSRRAQAHPQLRPGRRLAHPAARACGDDVSVVRRDGKARMTDPLSTQSWTYDDGDGDGDGDPEPEPDPAASESV
jgi:hypothetical protein